VSFRRATVFIAEAISNVEIQRPDDDKALPWIVIERTADLPDQVGQIWRTPSAAVR
jgi:hypothetical protein